MLVDKLIYHLTQSLKTVAERWKGSQFIRDAALLLVLNITSKGILFFGNAYAARCLGPLYLGISALVQTTVQQVALSYHGGFDLVAVRKIAGEKESCPNVTATIVSFRLSVAIFISVIWIVVCWSIVSGSDRFPWMMGVPLILISATNINFVFQGLEKLPIQNAINTLSSLVGAIIYFRFFSPGMFLGADLIVGSAVGILTIAASWWYYFRIFKQWPVRKNIFHSLLNLLRESWRYWILNIVVYFYSVFQIPLIAYLLDARDAGIYRSAFVMAAGLELLFNSINSLLLPRLVIWKSISLELLWRRQYQLFWIYFAIGIIPVLTLTAAANPIYNILLGKEFIEGAVIFKILVWGRFVVFLGQIYAWGLAATSQDRQFLMASIGGTIFSLIFNMTLVPMYGIKSAAVTSLLSELLVVSSCYLLFKQFIEKVKQV